MYLKKDLTDRGFQRAEFVDRYGSQCSIQESSLATENAIWLGVDKDFKNRTSESHRMHLTEDMVRTLMPILLHFLEFGDLWPRNIRPILDEPEPQQGGWPG